MEGEGKAMKHYCSVCMKPCEVVLRNDSFDHEFGTEKVLTEAPACHPEDDLLTREEWAKEVQENWRFRCAAREHYQRKPLSDGQMNQIFTEILRKYVRAA